MKETVVVAQIMNFLRFKRIFCWRQNNVGVHNKDTNSYHFHGLRGVSDILGALPGGRFLAIEVKSEKGRVSEHQNAFINNINSTGGLAFVARSFKEVEDKLKAEGIL